MDISSIASMYSDTYATAANQAASKLQNQIGGTDYSKASDEELMDACKQFEAYFIEQMYKGMLKTVPQSEYSSSATSTRIRWCRTLQNRHRNRADSDLHRCFMNR